MKLKLDVMEKERKTLRRDYLSISLFAGIIIITVIHFYLVMFQEQASLDTLKKQRSSLKLELAKNSSYKSRLSNLETQKQSLESKVNFINSVISKTRFSWFNFFQTLETITPKKVWVKDLQFQNGAYHIMGEGKTVYDVTAMMKRMQKLNCFSSIYLKRTAAVEIENMKLTEFEIMFRL